jgi:hypothetical protein
VRAPYGPQAIQRTAERIDDPSDELGADRHLEHAAGAPDLVAFAELEIVAENHGPEVVFLQVQREADDGVPRLGGRKLQHLTGHRRLEPVDAGGTVFDLEDRSDLLDVQRSKVGSFDFPEEDVLQFTGPEDRVSRHESRSGRCL